MIIESSVKRIFIKYTIWSIINNKFINNCINNTANVIKIWNNKNQDIYKLVKFILLKSKYKQTETWLLILVTIWNNTLEPKV